MCSSGGESAMCESSKNIWCSKVNHIKGRVKHGVKPGPATTLTRGEESALVEYIEYSKSRGFPMIKKICKAY